MKTNRLIGFRCGSMIALVTPGMAQILVIEDDPASSALLFECLSSMGHDVDCAAERKPAEKLLACVRYDLVITDLRLTAAGDDGLELLAGIREVSPTTRLLLVSANLRPETEQAARAIGADGCFGKPLEIQSIRRVVAALVRPGSQAVC
jgi:DNA-binding response OmpR family regulator